MPPSANRERPWPGIARRAAFDGRRTPTRLRPSRRKDSKRNLGRRNEVRKMDEADTRKSAIAPSFEAMPLANLIHDVRGCSVMMDSDLALLYQVETKRINESVRRNQARFPEEFCFQLTREEHDALRSQFATSNNTEGRGGRRYQPRVFTEQGIAMLSAVLHSDVAIEVSVRIMKAFVEMRRLLASDARLFHRMKSITETLNILAKKTSVHPLSFTHEKEPDSLKPTSRYSTSSTPFCVFAIRTHSMIDS